jgi:hypothetical protein
MLPAGSLLAPASTTERLFKVIQFKSKFLKFLPSSGIYDCPEDYEQEANRMTVPVETNPVPQIERRTDPFSRLAAAVISQAVEDATHGVGNKKKSAITWLLQDDDGFPFWCHVLGVDPAQTRQELSNLLASQTPNEVTAIFQSLLEPSPTGDSTLWSADALGMTGGSDPVG